MSIELVSLSLSNIRGFSQATLSLEPEKVILVGENNAGKSAALVVLHWIFNVVKIEDYELEYDNNDWTTLNPARTVGHKARRIVLRVKFTDGRTAKSYNRRKNQTIDLRFDLKKVNKTIMAKVGPPKKSVEKVSDWKAIQLLQKLRSFISL